MDNEDALTVSKGSMKVLSLILQETKTLNTDIALQSLDVLQLIVNQDSTTIQQLNKDSSFKYNFAIAISSLM